MSLTDFIPGYPIDLRRGDRRARAERGPLGDLEWKAGRVVARLTGQRVYLQDDGSRNGMADIRVDYTGGKSAFVEVTTDIEEGYAALLAGLMKGGQIPEMLELENLRREWSVTLSGSTNRRTLDRELGTLLHDLEVAGMTFETVTPIDVLSRISNPAVIRLVDLGVVMLSSVARDKRQGQALMFPDGISGPFDNSWQSFLDWVSKTLASRKLADVRRKLMMTGASDRHVFLGITTTTPSDVFFGLMVYDQGLPPVAPSLPIEVTHIWLWNIAGGDRCIAWFPDRGWLDVARNWTTD